MTHEREATLVGQVKDPERRVNRTGHLVHLERTPGPWVRITRDELQLLGGFIGQETLVFPPAIRLLEQGRLNLEPLVTHQIQLKELPAAIEELRAGRATKVEVVGFA
jgi:threonine dehydrogenase-like Zn-dependent dehydrogenase